MLAATHHQLYPIIQVAADTIQNSYNTFLQTLQSGGNLCIHLYKILLEKRIRNKMDLNLIGV